MGKMRAPTRVEDRDVRNINRQNDGLRDRCDPAKVRKRGRVVECTGLDEIAWSNFEQRITNVMGWPQSGWRTGMFEISTGRMTV
jgi:hypothetical protein